MKILPATIGNIGHAVEVLKHGGVVVHATETCYGFACDLSNPDAVKKLFDIKARPYNQPVSALFPSVDDAKHYGDFSPRALTLAKKHLPGPLTIVVPTVAANIYVTASSSLQPPLPSSIGIRISSHPLACALVEAFGRPIATTSANLHGQPNPYSSADILEQYSGSTMLPDLLLDSGVLPVAPPSTVVEVTHESVRILRQGALEVLSK